MSWWDAKKTREAMGAIVKRAEDGAEAAAEAGGGGRGGRGQQQMWNDVENMEQLKLVSWSTLLTLAALGAVVCVFCLVCILCCARRAANKNKKAGVGGGRHLFGVRRAQGYKDSRGSSAGLSSSGHHHHHHQYQYQTPSSSSSSSARPPHHRNPTPVSNPDRGAHYLKKSPSPTGAKSPPGGSSTTAAAAAAVEEEQMQRRALIASNQQARRFSNGVTAAHHHEETDVDAAAACTAPNAGNDNNASDVCNDLDVANGSSPSSSKLGQLISTVRYDFDKNALVVTVNRCQNLPPKDAAARSSDPYVKLQLLPDKQHKVKTRVMRRTLNPVYDEDFTFYGVQFNQLSVLTLHFVVLSFDRYSRDDVIGEVMVELADLDLSASDHQPVAINREITPRSFKLKTQGRGEILVSLCYQPAANRMTAVVLKARNLPKMDITGLSDPYVKIYLLYNGQRVAKKKTHVKKRTLNPVFNESFVFDLPTVDNDGDNGNAASSNNLANVSLEFLLLDWDRVTKNEVIGRLHLGGGARCDQSELHHWQEVVSSPRRQIAEWHKLKE